MNLLAPARVGALAATLLAAATAHADVIDIAWSAGGEFKRSVDVAPGKFVEICGALEPGQSVRWSYRAAQPLDFNVHYHAGKDVVYPARHDASRSAEGTLAVTAKQDYCWMWSSKQTSAVRLDVSLGK